MALKPFTITMKGTIAANGTVQLSYQTPRNQDVTILSLLHVSTGAFDITDIVDSEGLRYTNATQAVGIPNTALVDGADDFHGINPFRENMVLEGGLTIYFSLLDTSGASNDVTIVLEAIRDVAN